MRWLHRRNDAELGEARNVGRIDNLRVLDAPARLADFPLVRRDGFECLFVKIENHAVGAIADCVRLDLNAAAQCFFEHRPQVFRLFGEITGSVGRVAVRFEQRRAARAERAVENDFDRALREMVIVGADYGEWRHLADGLRISWKDATLRASFARAVNGVDKPQLHFSVGVKLAHKIDIVLVAAGVLNFAPAEFDLAFDAE